MNVIERACRGRTSASATVTPSWPVLYPQDSSTGWQRAGRDMLPRECAAGSRAHQVQAAEEGIGRQAALGCLEACQSRQADRGRRVCRRQPAPHTHQARLHVQAAAVARHVSSHAAR